MTKPDKDAAMLRWTEHPDYADALPLSHFEAGWQARAAAGMPARHWNPNRPTEPGWYWLWQAKEVEPAKVVRMGDTLVVVTSGSDDWSPLWAAYWEGCLWMPLIPPEPPRNTL
jgi:hypothetical protein